MGHDSWRSETIFWQMPWVKVISQFCLQSQRHAQAQHGQRISLPSTGRLAHLDEAKQIAGIHVIANAHRHVP